MEEKDYITLVLNRCEIELTSSITGTKLVITRENPKLFSYLVKYMNNIPLVDTKSIIGELDPDFPKSNKVYIRNRCGGTYYIIRDIVDAISFIYLQAQLDNKFEEFDVPVIEIDRSNYDFYSMTLGKELATLACVLDMPPEIACLLEEV